MENQVLGQQQIKQWCDQHKHRYVLARTHDNWCTDGFVEHVDDEVLVLAVPCEGEEWDNRAFLPGAGFGFGYPPFGYPIYPYPFYPRRRFRRQIFPLGALLGLSLLPFF